MIDPGTQQKLIIAIAVNIAAGQIAARTLGLPRWAGTVTAGAAMAAASKPQQLAPVVRGVVDLAVLPGKVVAELLVNQKTLGACCEPCAEKENET